MVTLTANEGRVPTQSNPTGLREPPKKEVEIKVATLALLSWGPKCGLVAT